MTELRSGLVIDVNLDSTQGSETGKIRPCVIVTNDIYNARVPVIQVVPITEWSSQKARIRTNVEIEPSPRNGLSKKSVADYLQTRPVDHRVHLVKIRGELEETLLNALDMRRGKRLCTHVAWPPSSRFSCPPSLVSSSATATNCGGN